MLSSSVLTRSFKGLAASLLAASISLAMPDAQANDSSIVLRGNDGWLFPGWGSLTEVDSRGIEASTALIKDAQQALAARGVQLQVLVLPDKTVRTGLDSVPHRSHPTFWS